MLLCQSLKCHCPGSLLGSAQSHGAKTANKKRIKVNEGMGFFLLSKIKLPVFYL